MSDLPALHPQSSHALRTVWLDVYVVCARMREGEVNGIAAEDVRTRLLEWVRAGRSVLFRERVPEDIVERVQRPVIALIDESARRCTAADFGMSWRPLAAELYGHDRLGGQVFEDIERVRLDPRTPDEVIEIFIRCLALGLEGQMLAGRPDALRDLRESLVAELRRRHSEAVGLSPELLPPGAPRKVAPILAPQWLALCAGLVLLLTAALLSMMLRSEARATERAIQVLMDTSVGG